MSNRKDRPHNDPNSSHCIHCGVEFDTRPWVERRNDPGELDSQFDHDCEQMKVDHVDVDDRYFACRCSGESRAECDWIMTEAIRILQGDPAKVTTKNQVHKENLLTHAVYFLNWDHDAKITGIPNDQWSAVCSRTQDVEMDKYGTGGYKQVEPPRFSTYIQCDMVEDGIAATVVAYYQKFGDSSVEK